MNVSCQCGAVSFRTPSTTPLDVYFCHCTDCQKQSSSAFGTSALFPAAGFFPLEPGVRDAMSVWNRPSYEGRSVDSYFCRTCGVRVLHRIREADGSERPIVVLKGGLVEGLDWASAKHIWTRSAVVPIPEGAVRHEKGLPVGKK